MPDMDYWLQQKYDILRQNADAEGIRANAAVLNSQAQMAAAKAAGQDNVPVMNPAYSAIPGLGAGSPSAMAAPGAAAQPAKKPATLGGSPLTDRLGLTAEEIQKNLGATGQGMGFRKGKTKIVDKDGEGSPTEDTVPAMLAEGEAVLNAGAAELLGRDQIKELNKRGLRAMGMPENSEPEVKSEDEPEGHKYGLARVMSMKDPVGYMCGTSSVKKGMRVHAAVGWDDVKNVASKATDWVRSAATSAAPEAAAAAAPEASTFAERFRQGMGQQLPTDKAGGAMRSIGSTGKNLVMKAAPYAPVIAQGSNAIDTIGDVMSPEAKGLRDTRVAEGVARGASTALGGGLGLAVGGPFAPITGAIGAGAGYFFPDAVMAMAGKKLPSEQIAERRAAAAQNKPAAQSPEATQKTGGAPNFTGVEEIRGTDRSKTIFSPNGVRLGNVPETIYMSGKALAGGDGKGGKMPEGVIVDPTTRKKDEFLTAQFNEEFLPKYAQTLGIPAKKLTAEQMADAKANFSAVQQANKAGVESGNGFAMASPATKYEWIRDLPVLTSGARGNSTLWQGIRDNIPFTDKGGLRVTTGGIGGPSQVIPANMIDYTDPNLYGVIQKAKEKAGVK